MSSIKIVNMFLKAWNVHHVCRRAFLDSLSTPHVFVPPKPPCVFPHPLASFRPHVSLSFPGAVSPCVSLFSRNACLGSAVRRQADVSSLRHWKSQPRRRFPHLPTRLPVCLFPRVAGGAKSQQKDRTAGIKPANSSLRVWRGACTTSPPPKKYVRASITYTFVPCRRRAWEWTRDDWVVSLRVHT